MIPAPLAITLGDPAGIGAEIIAKAWAALRHQSVPFFVIGDADVLRSAAVPVQIIASSRDAADGLAHAVPVLHRPLTHPRVQQGQPNPAHGPDILGWIELAVSLTLSGEARGIVTAPIAKASLYRAGFAFPGHTEFLADLTRGAPYRGVRGPVMMLIAQDLRTSLATIHIPLREVPERLTFEAITRTIEVTAQALVTDFGIPSPRLALAGLNPHAGETGTIGQEEITILAPVVALLQAKGYDLVGPLPSDSLFHAEARARFDAVVCLYHDQALIPVKMLDFWGGVNVTLGLPIIRTSPDHGTGFDIAGKGLARPDSLIAAIRCAQAMAEQRRHARSL